MQLCSDGHEEVAFSSDWVKDCPACDIAEETRQGMQEKIDELTDEIEDLQTQIDEHECE